MTECGSYVWYHHRPIQSMGITYMRKTSNSWYARLDTIWILAFAMELPIVKPKYIQLNKSGSTGSLIFLIMLRLFHILKFKKPKLLLVFYL